MEGNSAGNAPTQAGAQTQTATPQTPTPVGQAPQGAAPQGGNTVSDAAKEVMKKYKVKVDGQDMEVDEQELLRGYGHQKAANKKLQEGVAARKQAEMFISMLKDPNKFWEVAKKMGHDDRKMAEELLAGHLKKELMDPKDRELEEARAKLRNYEELEKKQKEAEKNKIHEEMKKKYLADYNDQFVGALKETNLPATKESVARMAQYISRSAKIGYELSPQEAAKMVKEDIQKMQMSILSQADGDTLLSLLGDDVIAKALTARGAKVKSPEPPTPQSQGPRRERSSGKFQSRRQWLRENGR